MIFQFRQLLIDASGHNATPLVFPPSNLEFDDVRITCQVISGSKRYSHQGDVRLSNETVQVSVFGKNYVKITDVFGDIDLLLSGYRESDGVFKLITVAGIAPDQYNQDTEIYQKSIDFNILYEE